MVRPSRLLGFIYGAPFLESADAIGFGDADFCRLEAALLSLTRDEEQGIAGLIRMLEGGR